jgi:hypothetical protein
MFMDNKNRLLRGILACAFGAITGMFIAFQLGFYLWWIGALVGGGLAYLAYDFKEVTNAGKQAYREVVAWQPDKGWWKLYLTYVSNSFGAGLTLGVTIWAFASFMAWIEGVEPVSAGAVARSALMIPMTGCVLALITGTFGCFMPKLVMQSLSDDTKYFRNPLTFFLVRVPFFCLIAGAVMIAAGVLYLYGAAVKTWKALKVVSRWLKRTFVLVHSEYRLMVGMDTALGVAGGYMLGNFLIGVALAVVLFVVNVELVAKRYLRLTPQW